MKILLLGITLLLCLGIAQADRINATVQWPGWTIKTNEDVVSARYPLSNLADSRRRTAWVYDKTHTSHESKPGPFNHGAGQSLWIVADTKLTLDGIALRLYGDRGMASRIWSLNRERLRSPELLVPGTDLRLP